VKAAGAKIRLSIWIASQGNPLKFITFAWYIATRQCASLLFDQKKSSPILEKTGVCG